MKKIVNRSAAMLGVFAFLTPAWGLEPPGASPGEKGIAEITRRASPSVVLVEARNRTRRVATGVVIDRNGHIVTTALISPRDETITVTTSEGKQLEAAFLGFDPVTHLAVVKTKEKGLRPMDTPKRPGMMSPGSWVCVIGVSPEKTSSVTQGIVSSVSEDRLRLNIWVMPGSSGGPVLDDKGHMVGLLRGIYAEESPVLFHFRDREQIGSGYVLSRAEAPSSGMAMAIPVDVVLSVADQIKKTGRVERGWLGVAIFQEEGGEVLITGVDGESPAGRAGLEPGDTILKIGGRTVDRAENLASEIRRSRPGREIVLTVKKRSGEISEVKVKLEAYSQEEARRELEIRFPRLFPPFPGDRDRVDPVPPQLPLRSLENRRYIGVYLEELNPELSEYFGVREGTGLLVSRLTEGGPAEKAGLKVGDVVVGAAGRRVDSINALIDIVQDAKAGDTIRLDIIREKRKMHLDVAVAEEESRGPLRFPDWEESLDAWEAFAAALGREAGRWGDESGKALREELERILVDVARRGREAGTDIKTAIRRLARRI